MEGIACIKDIERNTKDVNAIGKCIINCFRMCHKNLEATESSVFECAMQCVGKVINPSVRGN